MRSKWLIGMVFAATAACADAGEEEPVGDPTPEAAEAVAEPVPETRDVSDIACVPQRPREQLAERRSQYDSTQISIGGSTAQVCYGRPEARGREIFGGLVAYGQLWRTGADEPTTIHTPVAATIAGIAVEPGSYSLYTIPGEQEWTIIVNRSTTQWGHESTYTPEVEAQEVGRATVPAERIEEPVETFTIRSEAASDGEDLVLEWENTRVRVPVRPR